MKKAWKKYLFFMVGILLQDQDNLKFTKPLE